MTKVIVINGSPSMDKGNTALILNPFIEGMKDILGAAVVGCDVGLVSGHGEDAQVDRRTSRVHRNRHAQFEVHQARHELLDAALGGDQESAFGKWL